MAQPLRSILSSNPIADTLERLSVRFDALTRDARLGRPNAREYERQADEARAIAADLDAAFRASSRTVNPPIGRTANGGYIW